MRRLPLGRGHDPAPGPCRCQHPSRHFSPLVRQFQWRERERTRPLKEVCPAWSDHGSLPDVCHHRGLGSIPGPMSTETFPIKHDIALTSSVTEIDHLLAQLPCYGTGHRSKLNWLLLRTSLGHQSFISRVSINPPVSISPLTVILSYASPSSAPLGRTLTAV